MTTVLLVTLVMLFLPKLLALLLLLKDDQLRRSYGGMFAATLSVVLETVFSVLTAPVLMLFQTKFVLAILLRRAVGWPTQQRGDHMTSFKEAALAHGGHTLTGVIAGVLSYQYMPAFSGGSRRYCWVCCCRFRFRCYPAALPWAASRASWACS